LQRCKTENRAISHFRKQKKYSTSQLSSRDGTCNTRPEKGSR